MPKQFVDWTDIDSNFTKNPDGSIQIVRGDDTIRQSIKLILSTMRFERVRTEFGVGLYLLLFEPVDEDTAEDIEDLILNNLERFETRIRVRSVQAIPNAQENYYKLEIVYSILETREKKNLETFIPAIGDF